MVPKSDKENKGLKKSGPASPKPTAKPSSKKTIEDDDDEEENEEEVDSPKSAAKKGPKATASKTKKKSDEDDEDDEEEGEDEVDEWDKVEEDEEWDPDFDEFDVPRSKTKKAAPGGKKAAKGEEDDLGLDDDYKNMDLFNDSGFEEEEEDF
jgi:DNA-directed RNA polymerase subunit delta